MHVAKKEQASPKVAAASSYDVNRRDFLKAGVLAGAAGGVGLGAAYFGYGATVPNPVRVGVIGTGDEGNVLIGAINPNYVQVVAIADIRPYNVHRAFHGDEASENTLKVRPGLMKKYGWATEDEARKNVRVYDKKYEELLDNKDVEAVIIALPLHLHAEASIKAMRKGKHVLCEKLMAHSVHEAKEMALVAAQTKKYLAIGHQRHYSILYDNAAETIRRGLIGDVHYIQAQWWRGNLPGKDSWQQPLPDEQMLSDFKKLGGDSTTWLKQLVEMQGKKLPQWDAQLEDKRDKADFDYRQHRIMLLDKQVNPKDYGYQDFVLKGHDGQEHPVSAMEELVRWRLWNRTGGGLMAELGSHQLDAASIFVSALRDDGKKVHPLTVNAVGGREIFPLDRDTEDHVYCMFEFPGPDYYSDFDKRIIKDPNKKVVVCYSSINGNGYGGYGETVMGTKGTLIVEREQEMTIVGGADKSQTSIQAAKGGTGPTLDTTQSGGPKASVKLGTGGPISKGYTEEIEHWSWCIRNPSPENKPRCHPQAALADAVIALVSNIAIRQQKTVAFNPKWFEVDSPETPEGTAPDLTRYKS